MKSTNSEFGFSEGTFAKSLRKVLHPGLTEHDVECISIILISHLMIENTINKLLYKWMADNIPDMSSNTKEEAEAHKREVRKQVEDNIVNGLDFAKKVTLIKPLATALWKKEGKDILKDIYEINDIRKDIVHRLKIKDVIYKGKLLTSKEGIESFVEAAQQRLLNIDHLIELIQK